MSTPDHPWFCAHPVDAANIVERWHLATDEEIRSGMSWYLLAQQVATVIGRGDTAMAAGVIAVYSAQQSWIANVHVAARVLHTGVALGGSGSGVFASSAQRRAAERLLAREHHEHVLSGPKVRAFAHLIEHGGTHNSTTCRRVVVDRHALSVAAGTALSAAQYTASPVGATRRRHGTVTHPFYDHVVDCYHQATTTISHSLNRDIAAHQVQAVTWLVQQRLAREGTRTNGSSLLDRGRDTARRNAERAWCSFHTTHLPELGDLAATGYSASA